MPKNTSTDSDMPMLTHFLCSVESSEIDLSEFQDELRTDGDGGENGDGAPGQGGDNHPDGASTEPASGNAGQCYILTKKNKKIKK